MTGDDWKCCGADTPTETEAKPEFTGRWICGGEFDSQQVWQLCEQDPDSGAFNITCFRLDETKTLVPLPGDFDMAGTLGVPPSPASINYQTSEEDFLYCNAAAGATDITVALADLAVDVVEADGAVFPDGTLFSSTNTDHIIISIEVSAVPCDYDCNGDVITVDRGVTLSEGNGTQVHEIFTSTKKKWPGSSKERRTGLTDASTVFIPAGAGVYFCYCILDLSTKA